MSRRKTRISRLKGLNSRVEGVGNESWIDNKSLTNDPLNTEMPDDVVEVTGEQSWLEELNKLRKIMVIILISYYVIILAVGVLHFVILQEENQPKMITSGKDFKNQSTFLQVSIDLEYYWVAQFCKQSGFPSFPEKRQVFSK